MSDVILSFIPLRTWIVVYLIIDIISTKIYIISWNINIIADCKMRIGLKYSYILLLIDLLSIYTIFIECVYFFNTRNDNYYRIKFEEDKQLKNFNSF